ncbi:squalene/phytoene synthase family protein [Palleronia abyssalis]|uniref:All-trans-phytoene synthase n=1 Tax=Palleronia abyssalis TaxID=1501240 RepID=A0A2R8BYP3_9RHOB|nr:squalene/phytoene synthase family protein [Palleronia abyssalis]SPJ25291.1 All-trans-phytoene synthase [Palleronia abyssalis]
MNFAAASTEDADAAVTRQIVSRSKSSFTAGMRILPERRRRAIYAVYALCRAVDDIADGDAPGADSPADRARLLDRWEEEINRTSAGRPETAIGAEIARAREHIDLPEGEFHLILEGMRMDAAAIIAPRSDRLEAYIRRVAGAVGILSMKCFGAWCGPPSKDFALNLATGLQLVNILRDVETDARMGRLYIPAHILDTAGMPHDPHGAASHPNLPAAREALGRDARTAFDAAKARIGAHRRLPLVPALMMLGPYERLLLRWSDDWTRPPPRRSGWGKARDGLSTIARTF